MLIFFSHYSSCQIEAIYNCSYHWQPSCSSEILVVDRYTGKSSLGSNIGLGGRSEGAGLSTICNEPILRESLKISIPSMREYSYLLSASFSFKIVKFLKFGALIQELCQLEIHSYTISKTSASCSQWHHPAVCTRP